MLRTLIPRATVITPNLPEAASLIGRPIADAGAMEQAARDLLALRPRAVLLKGGHLEGDELVDLLLDSQGARRITDTRLQTRPTHGTGCTLASGIATGLAFGQSLGEAVTDARRYVRRAIETGPGFGKGHGPLNHGHRFAG